MGDPGMATRSQLEAGEELEAGQGGSGCRQRDTRRRGQAWPGAPQAGGPAVIAPLLLGTTRQAMNEAAMCPVYLCCLSAIMRGASLTLRCGTAWTPWRMVTLLAVYGGWSL